MTSRSKGDKGESFRPAGGHLSLRALLPVPVGRLRMRGSPHPGQQKIRFTASLAMTGRTVMRRGQRVIGVPGVFIPGHLLSGHRDQESEPVLKGGIRSGQVRG